MRLEFHPEAELEFIEAAACYERQVAGLGQRFEVDVRQAMLFWDGLIVATMFHDPTCQCGECRPQD
jgi:hypothetical protein